MKSLLLYIFVCELIDDVDAKDVNDVNELQERLIIIVLQLVFNTIKYIYHFLVNTRYNMLINFINNFFFWIIMVKMCILKYYLP